MSGEVSVSFIDSDAVASDGIRYVLITSLLLRN